jgi:hypothetical protein
MPWNGVPAGSVVRGVEVGTMAALDEPEDHI